MTNETSDVLYDLEGWPYMVDEDHPSLRWRLTRCCLAAPKGMEGGVACKGCYELVEHEACSEPVL